MTNVAGYQFIAGTQVNLFDRPWVVEPPLGDGRIPLRAVDGPDRQLFKYDYLLEALSEGKLEFVDHRSVVLKKESKWLKIQAGELTAEQEPEADQYIHYINELEVQGITTYTLEKYRRVIHLVAERMGFLWRPSPITLWRKRRDFLQSGRQQGALVRQHHRKGNRKNRFLESDIYELMEKVVDQVWLTEQKNTLQETYDTLEMEIARHNEFRSTDAQLAIPSYSTLWDYVTSLPRNLVVERRLGPKAAEAEFRNCHHAPKPKRILEMVAADHTRLDIIFIDRKKEIILGPASITLAEDVFSRCITGIHISYHPPCALTVNEMLKFAILKKTKLNTLCPGLKHEYAVYGLPEMLVVDNAKEFYSTGFLASCAELGIKIRWAKRRKPWWKAHVERILGTLNHSFVHALPGTNFGSIQKKGDYKPTKHAMVDFDDFMAALLKWIVDYYHQKPHRGLGGRAPAQVWAESARDFPPSLPRSLDALNAVLGLHTTRTIGRMGIEFDHLFYNCEDLQLLRNRFPLRKDAVVKIVVDEDDLGAITVYDPYDGEPFHVPALDQEYTRGLTLHQHRVHLRNLAQQGKSHVNREELLQAKADAFAIAKGALCDQKSAHTKNLAARYLNIKQTVQDKLGLTNLDEVTDGDNPKSQPPDDHAISASQASSITGSDLLSALEDIELDDEGWSSSFSGAHFNSDNSTGGEK